VTSDVNNCLEFQKRVLFQLAMLSRELTDIRRLLEKTAAHTTYAGADNGSQPDVDVARGPVQSVQAMTELIAKCDDGQIRQFLVCCLRLKFANWLQQLSNSGR